MFSNLLVKTFIKDNENIENEEEIKKYLSEVFKIPVEKIKLYSMGG